MITAGIGLLVVSAVALMQTPAVSQLLTGTEEARPATEPAPRDGACVPAIA